MLKEVLLHYECLYCGNQFTVDVTWNQFSHIKAQDTCIKCNSHSLKELHTMNDKRDIFGYNYNGENDE